MRSITKPSHLLLGLSFVLFLFLPFFQQHFEMFELSGVTEGRRKVKFPQLKKVGLIEFTRRFERYYNDNFGFRDFLIKINNSIKFHLFGVSTSDQVLIGKDGWLYLTAGTALDKRSKKRTLTQQNLQRKLRLYQEKADFLQNLGIKYLLIVAPNKNSIYPEFYPDYAQAEVQGKYEQFINYMNSNSKLVLTDIKPKLIVAKNQGELFFRGDSHWNDLGAFIAYQEIAEKLKQQFPQIEIADLDNYKLYKKGGASALIRMLGIFKPTQHESIYLKPKQPDLWYNFARKQRSRHAPFIVRRNFEIQGQTPDSGKLVEKAIVYRDSFFARLAPFVSLHFKEIKMYSTQFYKFDKKLIEQERPSIVIEEIVERSL